jgi:hypothetical protein
LSDFPSHTLVPRAGQLTEKHLQKLIKFFDEVSEAEQERERQEERKREVAKERTKKGNKRTASMLVRRLHSALLLF